MAKIKELVDKTTRSIKNQGLNYTLKTINNWIFYPETRMDTKLNPRLRYDNVDQLVKKIDFNKSYENGKLDKRVDPKKIRIGWIISPFHIGSGGHQTIFRFIKYLEKHDFENHIYITDGHGFKNEKEAYDTIQEHFIQIPTVKVSFLTEENIMQGDQVVEDCDVLFATRYNTAYYSAMIDNCIKRMYFVQDLENLFFPTSYLSVLVENSYRMGMIGVCASPWLARSVGNYNMRAHAFYLGYDHTIYVDKDLPREPNSVAFYGRYESERRAVELGMQALELVQNEIPDLKAYIYGTNNILQGYDINVINKGLLTYGQMSDLFSTVQVGMSFSLTNYGLTPTEMMASGLPVVELAGDNTRSVFKSGENILLADKNPMDIADNVIKLFRNGLLREQIIAGGFRFVQDKKWEDIWAGVEDFLRRELADY